MASTTPKVAEMAADHPADPDEWLRQAAKKPGSWWTDYVDWLHARSGDLRPAPAKLGSSAHKASAKAPKTYVLAT